MIGGDKRGIAVLSGGRLHAPGVEPFTVGAAHLTSSGALAALAHRFGARQLWIADDRPIYADATWWADKGGHPWSVRTSSAQGEAAPTVGRYDAGGRDNDVRLYHSARDPRWGWSGETDPAIITRNVRAFETAMDRYCGWSPAQMSLAIATETSRKHADWLRYEGPNELPVPEDGSPHWDRRLTADEAKRRFIHVYDVNAAYLAAAGSVQLPCGSVKETTSFNPKRPGLYLVEPDALTGNARVINRRGWYDSAQVKAAQLAGQAATIVRGYTWQESHAAMRDWASAVWNARQVAESYRLMSRGGACELAVATVKMAYTSTIGRLVMKPQRPEPNYPWYLPHWWGAIIAEAGRRRWDHWWAFRNAGAEPFMVHVDALYFVSDVENPAEVAPGIMARSTALGGYKHVLTAPLTAQMTKLINAGDGRKLRRELAHGED